MIREARLHLAGYGLIAAVSVVTGSWAAVLYWLAPLLLTKPAHQLQNLIEHVGLPHSDDIFANTRSTRTNAFMRWMCWQMQYHTAHHAFPSVPFFRLKRAAYGNFHRARTEAARDDLSRLSARDHPGVEFEKRGRLPRRQGLDRTERRMTVGFMPLAACCPPT